MRLAGSGVCAAFACALLSFSNVSADPVSWTGLGDGVSWSNPGNWSPGLPTAADDVTIPAGPLGVTVASNVSVRSLNSSRLITVVGATLSVDQASSTSDLTMTNAQLSGAGDLRVTSTMTWNSGSMVGTGKTIVPAGGFVYLSGNGARTLGRTIENSGMFFFTGGSLAFADGRFANQSGGIFTVTGNATAITDAGGANAFLNGSASGPATFNSISPNFTIGVPLTSVGLVNVGTGTLRVALTPNYDSATNALTGGTWAVGPGAVLNFPTGANVKIIAAGVGISLNGAGSSFPAIAGLKCVNGSLTLLGGQSLAVSPAEGLLTNNGTISLAAGCTLAVTGGFTQNPVGTFASQLSIAMLDGRINASGPVFVDGSVNVAVEPGAILPCGQSIVLVSGANLSGKFAQESVPTPPGGTHKYSVLYGAATASLAGSPLADLASIGQISAPYYSDGLVTIEDLDAFLSSYFSQLLRATNLPGSGPQTPGAYYADVAAIGQLTSPFTPDGNLTIEDLDAFFSLFLTGGCN